MKTLVSVLDIVVVCAVVVYQVTEITCFFLTNCESREATLYGAPNAQSWHALRLPTRSAQRHDQSLMFGNQDIRPTIQLHDGAPASEFEE